MKLLIIRHAIAMERADYQAKAGGAADDDFRPLTSNGARKMRKNARGLRGVAEKLDALVTSPLTRAVQTSDICRAEWAVDGLRFRVCEHLRPDSEPEALARWLRSFAKKDLGADSCLGLVGHEPHLSCLVGWFLYGAMKSAIVLKKGGACFLEFPSFAERGNGRLVWLATPGMLRGLG